MIKIYTVNRVVDGITRSALAAYKDREEAEQAKDRLSKSNISKEYSFVVDDILYYDKDYK